MRTSEWIGSSSGVRDKGPFEFGTFHTDFCVRRDSDPVGIPLSRTQTKVPIQNRFRWTAQEQSILERDIRREERFKERARLVQELHDTLFQGFVGASLLLYQAAEQTPADSPSKPALTRALDLVHRALDEGRATMRGLRATSSVQSNLEQAFSSLITEVTTQWGPRFQILVQGETQTLDPSIKEQLYIIGREAVMNALRHSQATEIEVEVRYRRDLLRVFVRDNGCGINPEAVQRKSGSHWGLRGMHDRAENIGARFEVRGRPGGGTEVGVVTPIDLARQTTH